LLVTAPRKIKSDIEVVMQKHFSYAAVFAASLFISGSALAATSGVIKSPDTSDPVGPFPKEFNGEPPSDIVSLAPDLLALIDHVTGVVVFTNGAGVERSRNRLPGGFRVNDVRIFPDRTALIDVGGKKKIVFRLNAPPPDALPATDVTPNDPDAAAPTFVLRKFRRVGIKPQKGAGFERELVMRSVTPDAIASATYLGMDSKGRAYSLAREIQAIDIGTLGKPRYKLRVTLTIGQHDRTGRRLTVATLPLDEMFKMPRGRYVAVNPDGGVVAMLPLQKKGARKQGIYLYRPKFEDEVEQKKAPKPLANAQATLNKINSAIPDASAVPVSDDLPGDTSFELKDQNMDNPAINIAGRRTVAQMKKAAHDIMTFSWDVRPENLSIGHQENCSFGKGDAERSFELPHAFKHAKENQRIQRVPYNWSGKDDLPTIRAQLKNGYRAGNICSEVEEKSPNTAGLDCSGFMSQIWGIGDFGTKHIDDVADNLEALEKMQWGDAFNLKEHHIRLYVGREKSDEHGMRIHTLESTSACSGTCEVSYDVEHFHNYEMVRLKPKAAQAAKRM
jgi:hypothetical protein